MAAGEGFDLIVGSVGVEIVPSTKGLIRKIQRALRDQMAEAGEDAGEKAGDAASEKIQKGVTEGFEKGAKAGREKVEKEAKRGGTQAGDVFGGSFAESMSKRLAAATRSLSQIKVDVGTQLDTSTLDGQAAAARERLSKLAQFTVTPNLDEGKFRLDLAGIEAELKEVSGQKDITIRARAEVGQALAQIAAIDTAMDKANSSSGVFARTIQSTLTSALNDLPDPEIDLHLAKGATGDVGKQIIGIRDRLEDLRGLRIGVDIDSAEALDRLGTIREELATIGENAVLSPDVRFDASRVAAALDSTMSQVGKAAKPVIPEFKFDKVDRQLGLLGSQISAGLKKAIAGFGDLPVDFTIDADDAQARLKIEGVRLRLKSLDEQVKLGLDTDEALAKAAALEAQLDAVLRDKDITISAEVRTNANQVRRDLQGLSADTTDLAVKAKSSFADIGTGFRSMSAQSLAGNTGVLGMAGAFGALAVTASAVLSGVVGLLAAVAAAAGVAAIAFVGVYLALSPIVKAIMALNEQDTAQGMAQAAARANSYTSALEAVTAAQDALSKAREDGAIAIDRARQAEASANVAYKRAVREQNDAAAAQVTAQKKVTEAKKETIATQRQLALELSGAKLDVQSADIGVMRAEAAVNKATFDPASTDIDRAEAGIEYRQAVQRAKEARQSLDDIQKRQTKAAVDAAAEVTQAEQRLEDAKQAVKDAEVAKKNAAIDAGRTQTQVNQQVIAAERALVAAKRNRAQVKQTNDAADPTADLSPQEKAFVDYYEKTLKPKLHELRRLLTEPIQNAILKVLQSIPQETWDKITTAVTVFGTAIGNVFGKISGKLTDDDTFGRFLDSITENGPKVLDSLTDIVLGLGDAFTELLIALGPSSGDLIGFFGDLAKDLGEFTKTDDFKKLMDYIMQNTPTLVDLVGSMAVIFGKLLIGAAPIAQSFLELADAVAYAISTLPPGVLTGIAAAILLIASAALAFVNLPLAFVALAAGVALAISVVMRHLDDIKGAFAAAWQFIVDGFHDRMDELRHAFDPIIRGFKARIADLKRIFNFGSFFKGNPLGNAFGVGAAGDQMAKFGQAIQAGLSDIGARIGGFFTGIGRAVAGWLTGLRDRALELLTGIGGFFRTYVADKWMLAVAVVGGVIGRAVGFVRSARDNVLAFLREIGGFLQTYVVGVWSLVVTRVENVFARLQRIVTTARDTLFGVFGAIGGLIEKQVTSAWRAAVTGLAGIFDVIRGYAAKPVVWVINHVINDGILGTVNRAAGLLGQHPKLHVDIPGALAGYATGTGYVLPGYGPGRDTELAMLAKGESVLVPELTRQIGPEKIMAWNYAARTGRQIPGFATGVAGFNLVKPTTTYPDIDAIIEVMSASGITGWKISSTNPSGYRGPKHSSEGYHGQNKAVDFGGDGRESVRQQIAAYWFSLAPALTELAHTKATGYDGWYVKNGASGNGAYTKAQKDTFRKSVHVAATAAALTAGLLGDYASSTVDTYAAPDELIAQMNTLLDSVRATTEAASPVADSGDGLAKTFTDGAFSTLTSMAKSFVLKTANPFHEDPKDPKDPVYAKRSVGATTAGSANAAEHHTPTAGSANAAEGGTYFNFKPGAGSANAAEGGTYIKPGAGSANAAEGGTYIKPQAGSANAAEGPLNGQMPKRLINGVDYNNLAYQVMRWKPNVINVLRQLGVNPLLAPVVLRRIMFNSGGDQHFKQPGPVRDEGSRRVGLMGVPLDLFSRYVGPYRQQGFYGPNASIYAGLQYALEKFGSVPAMDPFLRPALYDQGGWIPPGVSLVRNDTNTPEPVLNSAQWDAMMRDRQQSMQGGLQVRVRVDDGAVPGLVNAEVDKTFGVLADAKVYSGR